MALAPDPPLGVALVYARRHHASCRCTCCEKVMQESELHPIRGACDCCRIYDGKMLSEECDGPS